VEETTEPIGSVDQTRNTVPDDDVRSSLLLALSKPDSEKLFSAGLLRNLPVDIIDDDDQQDDVKAMLEAARSDLKKALRLDGGVSKERYFVIKKEDRKRYLTIPSNSSELIKIPGWDSLFSILMQLGVAMKLSDSEYKNPGSSEDTKKYFAGLANRISKDDWSVDDDKFMISSTKAAERGRVTADLYALKKTSSVMNLEKYLPESSRIGKTSYIRHYLTLIAGPNNVETLKAIPDLVNKIMSNWVETYSEQFEEIAEGTTISIGQVVGDLTRKKKIKVKKDGKNIEVLKPIHAVRVSDSPFAITEEEVNHLKRHERSWDELQRFNDKYSEGVPITDIEQARDAYKNAYDEQMKFAQQTGAFKARRMEAFKELASFSMKSKEVKEFKLTKKSREIALDNFAKALQSYNAEDDSLDIDIDKILVNMRPSNIPHFNRDIWNVINKENLLYIYSDKQPSNRRRKFLETKMDDIHDELVKYFPSVANLAAPSQDDEGDATYIETSG
jgi:ribosomal protein L21E